MTKRALESSYESTDSPCPRTFDRAPIRTALADDDFAKDFGAQLRFLHNLVVMVFFMLLLSL